MKDKVNSVVIGLGAIGPTHIAALRGIPEAHLYGVCDIVREKADKFAAENGCKAFYSLEDVLKDRNVDLVHLCVPSGLHAKLGVAAAQAGKHVLSEKPIDVSLEAADALIEACRAAGVRLGCISQHRFDSSVMAAHEAMCKGRFGTLTFGGSHTKWYRSQAYYDSGDWRGTWALDGGGALMNQSVHYVDMVQYLMGGIEEVSAYCATRAHERIEVEDIAAATVKFKNGAIGLIEGNTAAFPGFYTRLDINGTKGSVIIEADKIVEWKFADEGESADGFYGKISDPDKKSENLPGAASAEIGASSHQRQLEDMVHAIIENRDPLVTGEEARKPLSVILAIYESARLGGKPVKVV